MTIFGKQCKRVVLGISGGIDSSVAAFILKNKGFHVEGLFMRNWNLHDENGTCSIDKDLQDAEETCAKIGISFNEVNFSKDYWNYVFTDLIEQYQSGYTPNPDILCNRHIKFKKFVNYAFEKFGADAIATGHYAQSSYGNFLEFSDNRNKVHLLKAVDTFKDQTFFLSQIKQESLSQTMFPLGSLTKSKVKKIALENNLLHVVKKKESTGICFIGQRNFSSFISEYLPDNPGLFIDVDTGNIMGSHRGIHHWTIGQRCRVSGQTDRVYIAKKIPETQEILIARGRSHLLLWSQYLTTGVPHWIHSLPLSLEKGCVLKCDFRFQHTKPTIPCQVLMKSNNSLIIKLQKPLFALTAGQYAVLYKDNKCLGSARIEATGPSFYTLNKVDQFSLYE